MKTNLRYALVPSMIAMAVALTACGGGGGDSAPSAPPAGSTPQSFTVNGSAAAVASSGNNVSVLFTPATLSGSSLPQGTVFNAASVPFLNFHTYNLTGAYTQVAASDSATSALSDNGTISDVAGVGGFVAIGRWTNGSDTTGGTYNANQGAAYAVGTPLTLTASSGTLSCSKALATSPVSTSGSVAPGSLTAATATLDLATLTLSSFSATVAIGADSAFTFISSQVALNQVQSGGGNTFVSRVMGNDATKPVIAVSYGTHATSTGDINGLVVLTCAPLPAV